MRKLINEPADFVDEVIDGILLAHGAELRAVTGDRRALVRSDAPGERVGIVTGGGSGHLPLFLGYVGRGLCSGVAVGNVFSSPSAEQIMAATAASDSGRGVLYLFGNYGGDVMNFGLAADLAELEGIDTRTVAVHDDVFSAPADRAQTRRGTAGLVLAYKCAGAAAERGDSLAEVTRLATLAAENVRTVGVGLSPTILPAAGLPTFELPDGEMEIGIGIHGEPGRERGTLQTADAVAGRMITAILDDLEIKSGERAVVLVDGLGATPLEELYLLFRQVKKVLDVHGIIVYRNYIGEFVTSLEMAGASITILRLDDELADLVDAPASSPFFRQ
jgi:phosphoenolpyruvate---glycerone phosphotransferase subunit DhaK